MRTSILLDAFPPAMRPKRLWIRAGVEINMSRVVVYSTAFCPYCYMAKRVLERHAIAYDERRLTRRDRTELEALAEGGRTFPQILVDGASIGGFAELRHLERDGTLERMLAARS